MKKLILVIAAFCFAAIVSAQNGAAPATVTTPASASGTSAASASHTQVWYGCPKCDYTSQKAGKCPKDNLALAKDHSYACPKCGATSDKAGKCTDGTDFVMVDCKVKMMNARKAASPPVNATK